MHLFFGKANSQQCQLLITIGQGSGNRPKTQTGAALLAADFQANMEEAGKVVKTMLRKGLPASQKHLFDPHHRPRTNGLVAIQASVDHAGVVGFGLVRLRFFQRFDGLHVGKGKAIEFV